MRLALAICISALVAAQAPAQDAFVGLHEPATDGQFYWVGTNWSELRAKNLDMSRQGFQLVDLDAYSQGGEHKFTSVWRSGSPNTSFDRLRWDDFTRENDRRTRRGERLIRFRRYKDGSDTFHVGVWAPGTDAFYLWVGVNWTDFKSKWEELSRGGLRLVDLETWTEGPERKWAGVWREGHDAHMLWVGEEWGGFQAKHDEFTRQGLHLTVLRFYEDGSSRRYAGVWREGAVSQNLVLSEDFEKLRGRVDQLSATGQLLSRLVTLPGRPECLNQLSSGSPDSSPDSLPGSSLHCEGPPASCTSASTGARYRRPISSSGGNANGVLLSALEPMDAFLTLPFANRQVSLGSGWLYKRDDWHRAIDYQRPGALDFPVRAAAAGRVIFVGWDNWSGNTVVLSHDVNGGTDNYRTIYMHLRNGPHNDCGKAWDASVGSIGGQEKRYAYKARLNSTGCFETWARHPMPLYWGTDDQALASDLFGKTLQAGDEIGWAGETGPGGAGLGLSFDGPPPTGFGPPNTHLHIYFARRNPSDSLWYYFDPYGVYAEARFYGGTVTSPPPSDCARYPSAWKDGQPQYQSSATDGPEPSAGNLCGGCTATPPGTRGTCASGLVCHSGRCEEPCPPWKRIDDRCMCVERPSPWP